MSEDMKNNRCQIVFVCGHTTSEPCQYFSGTEEICKYRNGNYRCESYVANLNKMTILLEKIKGA